MSAPRTWVSPARLIGELQAAGIATAFVCPGSRSAPLALAIAEHPRLQHSVHVDERSAAFQALGFGKASGQPVVLLCTSGTAGANFLPAVAEAAQSRVPLIVLTADRPPELRAWGAPQTMEQRTLYAGFARWSEEAPCPSERGAETRVCTRARAACRDRGDRVQAWAGALEPAVPRTAAAFGHRRARDCKV